MTKLEFAQWIDSFAVASSELGSQIGLLLSYSDCWLDDVLDKFFQGFDMLRMLSPRGFSVRGNLHGEQTLVVPAL